MTAMVLSRLVLSAAGPAVEHESAFSPANPEFWVYTGITIFLVLAVFVFKLPKLIAGGLDKRIAEAKRQLDEAAAIRAEAEKLLADAKTQQAESHKHAEAIIAQAKDEAAEMVASLEAGATDLIARRQKMAEDKIAAAERTAVADLRASAANAATTAAVALIGQLHDAKADKALIDETIGKLTH